MAFTLATVGAEAGERCPNGTTVSASERCSDPDSKKPHTWGAPKRVYHRVKFCFLAGVGTKGARTKVSCADRRALYDGGKICFVASDGREYNDFPKWHGKIVVTEGQRFFNRRKASGGAEPDWPHLD